LFVGGEKQSLPAAAGLHPIPRQPCRDHAAVIEYQRIACVEVTDQIAHMRVVDRPGTAIDEHQPRVAAGRHRLLRDQFARQLEIIGIHLAHARCPPAGTTIRLPNSSITSPGCNLRRRRVSVSPLTRTSPPWIKNLAWPPVPTWPPVFRKSSSEIRGTASSAAGSAVRWGSTGGSVDSLK